MSPGEHEWQLICQRVCSIMYSDGLPGKFYNEGEIREGKAHENLLAERLLPRCNS